MKTLVVRVVVPVIALLLLAAFEPAESQPAENPPAFQNFERALSQQIAPNNLVVPLPGTQAGQQVQPAAPQPFQPFAPAIQPQTPAQPQQPAQPAQPQPPPPQIQPPQPLQFPAGGHPGAKRGEVSFNFDDADVFSVIQTIFGDVLKVNYIVEPNVKGRVTFRSVAPVAKEDVLPLMEVILRLNGIGIVEEGGLYRIVPIGDLAREPAPVGVGRNAEKVLITGKALLQVVPVKYIQSSEIVRVLTPFLSKNALIIDVPKSNYIIISDTDTNVKRLLQLVEIFDSEQIKKIKPEVFVYPVQNGKAKDIAAMLQQIFLGAKGATPSARTTTPAKTTTTTPGQQPAPVQQPQVSMGQETGEALVSDITRIFPDEITNSIIILATPDDYDLIAETIAKIDVQPRQVVIEGLLARVDLTDNFSLGVAWSMKTNAGIKDLSPLTNKETPLSGTIGVQPSGTSLANTLDPGFTFVATDPSGNVRARITAAVKDSKAKILAAPHILVSDNREARIQVGSQVPLATSTTTTPIGGVQVTNTTTSTIQYKDIGIILKVKPQVNDSGLVSLEIAQEISSLGDNINVGGTTQVSINKTEATTNLVARDGETIVIGGLIREDVTKSKDGIPILSKIPLIGSLFSNTSDSTTRTELILLLTPRVVRTQQEAGNATSDYVEKFKRGTKDRQIDEFIKERKKEGKNSTDTEK